MAQRALPPVPERLGRRSTSNDPKNLFSTFLSRLTDEKSENSTCESPDSKSVSFKGNDSTTMDGQLHRSTLKKTTSEHGIHKDLHQVIDRIEERTLGCVSRQLPRRIVFAKGCGVFGYFQLKSDILKEYTNAVLFNSTHSRQVETFIRFSAFSSSEGSADTRRDIRGFSVRFYTDDGNFDLVGTNLPVFYIRDPRLFPALVQSMQRNKVTNLQDASAMWTFFAENPETVHALLLLYADRGLPSSYRQMNGYGCHTYQLANKQGQITYAKFVWRPKSGVEFLPPKDASRLAAVHEDYYCRDLYTAVASGNPPSWELYVQLMTPEEAKKFPFSPFDSTKVWPQQWFPRKLVGLLTANRNPTCYSTDVEQVSFNPGNLIPGIYPTADPMFQARLSVYSKAALFRIGRTYNKVSVNQESDICRMKGGFNRSDSTTDLCQSVQVDEEGLQSEFDMAVNGHSEESNFAQAKRFWCYVLDREGRKRVCSNMACDLKEASDDVQSKMLQLLAKVEPQLSKGVQCELERWEPFKVAEDVPSMISAYLQYGFDQMSFSTPNLSEKSTPQQDNSGKKKRNDKTRKIRQNCNQQ